MAKALPRLEVVCPAQNLAKSTRTARRSRATSAVTSTHPSPHPERPPTDGTHPIVALGAFRVSSRVKANYRSKGPTIGRSHTNPPVHRFASSLDMLELVFDSTSMVLTEGAYPTTDSGQPQAWLEDLAQRVRPVTLAGEQLLPVPRALEPLLPDRGLRRGGTVAVDGSLALALALVAGASAAGSWVVAVGLPDLGVVAAAEAGIVLERLALVPKAGPAAWGAVVAALLDAIDVVLVRPRARLSAAVARRLAATASQWEGLGQGYGRLEARKVEVAAAGRGAAVLERRAKLWLPSPDAQQGAGPRHDRYVRAVEEETDSRVVRPWKGREVDTSSAASKGRLLQSV